MGRTLTANDDRLDLWLALATACVAVFAGVLLAQDRYLFVSDPTAVEEREKMARIDVAHNVVRTRSADLPIWDSASAAQDLYLKDLVFTDAESTATLAFDDKTVIELGENTLIAVERQENRSVLNVIKGTLRATAPPGVEPKIMVKTGRDGKLVKPRAASAVRVAVTEAGTAEVAVLKGGAEVGGVKVEEAQATRFEKAVEVVPEAKPLLVMLAEPAHGAVVEGAAVELSWRAASESSPRVEVARDEGFRKIVGTKSGGETAVVPLAPGTYHWRVVAGDGSASEVRRITVAAPLTAPAPAPAPALPVAPPPPVLRPRYDIELLMLPIWRLFESLAYAQSDDPSSRTITWPAVPEATRYHIEIARDQEFRDVVLKKIVPSAAFEVNGIDPGQYYLRVRSESAEGLIGDPSNVSIVIARRAPLKTVALLAPDEGEVVTLRNVVPVVNFSWKELRGAGAYTYQIAKDEDFRDIFLEKRTRGLSTGVELAPARYYWRVRGLRTADDPGPWTAARIVDVRHEVAPELKAKMPAAAQAPLAQLPAEPTPQPIQLDDDSDRSLALPALALPDLPIEPAISLSGAFAPSRMRYDAPSDSPRTKINATLFNSYAAAGRFWLSRRFAVDANVVRTGTVLFRKLADGDPEGQKPLVIQPFSFAAAARYRVGGVVRGVPYLDLRLGYGLENLVRFRQTDAMTLSVKHENLHGPLAGVEVGIRLGSVTLRADGSMSRHGIGAGAQGLYHLGETPWSVLAGATARRQRTPEVKVDTTSFLLGAGLGL